MTGSEKKGVCNGCTAKCEGHALAVIAATFAAISSTAVEVPGPNPVLPGTVVRTVEVYPGAEKNKAFPLEQGGGMCDLFLDPVAPWQIRSSWIEMRDDQTLWRKVNDCEYQMSYGYAPNEYVVVKGDLYKPSSGSGNVVKLPEFMVTVPKVDLNWAAKHGDAAREEAEDLIPAAILVSSDWADFGSLVVHGPKDDFNLSSPDVTLSWDNASKVKVRDGVTEIHSGHKFSVMQGATKTLSVQALDPAVDVKFTLEGEPDNVNGERAVDYVHACCCVKIELVTPGGDPVNSPVSTGVGQNEFTFSPDTPGVLTMNLMAKVTPAQALDKIKGDCVFAVDSIGASTMSWANDNPSGKAVADNGFLKATVTFTGLPANNSDFGKKQAKISYGACVCDTGDYEVFFPKTAANHPGGQTDSPNWYHYWAGEAVPGYDLSSGRYSFAWGGCSDYAEYDGNPNNPHFTIYGPASAGHESYTSAGLVVDRRGVDTCAATLRHEKQHRQTDLDWLPGGAWFMKLDTDGDELPDDWEDSHAGFDKYSSCSFSPSFIYGDDEEVWCEMNALNERGNYGKDWANPGKQSVNAF